jgi:hypothetical protein
VNKPLESPVLARPGERTTKWFGLAWKKARKASVPYRHWLLTDALPPDIAKAIVALPIAAPEIDDTQGRRDSHNSTRTFFSVENRKKFAVCDEVAAAFQNPATVYLLQKHTGTDFSGSFLRIEYCQDTDGFYLEPHTDIGAKLITLSVFLSEAPGSEEWGTDIYDNERHHVGRAPAAFNNGYAFIPATDTWHGVEKRNFKGIRRSIIVNYVKPEWRSRHELAYPDAPV